jgi:hypothetical protein
MAELRLTILTASGTEYDIETPDDISIRDAIRELTVGLSLPITRHDGTQIEYRLDSKGLGRRLLNDETFASAKVPSQDSLILTVASLVGGGSVEEKKSRISIIETSIGLPLDDLASVDVKNLLSNEPALMMTLHSYRTTLSQLDDTRQELRNAKEEIEQLLDRLKEKNIATALLILGQVQVGFGTNLVTSNSTGGWFVFLAGLALNLGALYFSFFGIRNPFRSRRPKNT